MQGNMRYNVIVNLIRTVCLTLLSFISFPFVCNALKDSALGTYAWANTFVYYFLIIAKLGIPNLAIRECVKVKNDRQALSKKAQEFFILQSLLTLISFGLMCVIIFSFKGDFFANKELIFVLSINFLVGVFSFEWIYIALEKHFYISFRSVATIALSSILIIALVKYEEQIYLYAFLTILVTIITVICNLIGIKKYISFKKIGKYNFKQYITPLIVIFSISLALTLYNHTDAFILGFFDSTKKAVGSYSVGIKGIEIIITVITSLSAVFIPRATHLYQQENKIFFNNLTRYAFNICLFIAIPAIITMTLLSTQITDIISGNAPGFDNAASSLCILAVMVLTFSLCDMIYSQILLPMQKEKYYLYVIIVGVVFNIGGSIALGFAFESNPIIGIAIATITTDAIILALLLILTRKYVSFALFNRNSLKLLISGVLVAVSTVIVLEFIDSLSNYLQIIIVVGVGMIIYLAALLLMKENLVTSFIHKRNSSTHK